MNTFASACVHSLACEFPTKMYQKTCRILYEFLKDLVKFFTRSYIILKSSKDPM